MTPEYTERLFSYGTLQTETVQISLFGRRLEGNPDALVGYCLVTIQVQDQSFVAHSGAMQRNLLHTGNSSDVVEGSAFMLTKKDLERADKYEPAEYRRVKVRLRSGLDAWVYLSKQQ
jgi:gamma-glutamyl AIG2-like cyclotransferase